MINHRQRAGSRFKREKTKNQASFDQAQPDKNQNKIMSRFINFKKTKDFIVKKPGRIGFSNIKVLNIAVVGLICLGGLFYLIQVNSIAAQGYEIKNLQQRINGLKQESAKLELKTADFQAMNNIQKRLDGQNMVSVAKEEYLSGSGAAVAVR